MSQRTDMLYGRQGGRIIEGAPTDLARGQRLCDTCGEPMLGGQRRRHHLCDTDSIAGRACTCPPGCTDTHVGDTGTCATRCEVCTTKAGESHADVNEWRGR